MAMERYRCGGGLLRGDDGIEMLHLLTNSVADFDALILGRWELAGCFVVATGIGRS